MKKRGLRMVYTEPGSPVTPEQMESGVFYFLSPDKTMIDSFSRFHAPAWERLPMTPGDQNAIFV